MPRCQNDWSLDWGCQLQRSGHVSLLLRSDCFLSFSLSPFRLLRVSKLIIIGNIPSISADSHLGRIKTGLPLSQRFSKIYQLIFFCSGAWPQYKLGDGEKWLEKRALNDIILSVGFFFFVKINTGGLRSQIQTFMSFCQNSDLCKSCRVYYFHTPW
jgi:hypothetical protein